MKKPLHALSIPISQTLTYEATPFDRKRGDEMKPKTAWHAKPQSEKPSIARFDAQHPSKSQTAPKPIHRGNNVM